MTGTCLKFRVAGGFSMLLIIIFNGRACHQVFSHNLKKSSSLNPWLLYTQEFPFLRTFIYMEIQIYIILLHALKYMLFVLMNIFPYDARRRDKW